MANQVRPWLSSEQYQEMAAEAKRRGFGDLDRYFQKRAHDAAVVEQQDHATARDLIERARAESALEYEALASMEVA